MKEYSLFALFVLMKGDIMSENYIMSSSVTLAQEQGSKDKDTKDAHLDNDIIRADVIDELEQLKLDITQATEDYINRLHNPEDIIKPNVFNGLVLYIYTTCICGVHNNYTPIDTGNIRLLYTLWNYYVSICAMYDKTLTIVQFCSLLGVHKATFYKWVNGLSRKTSKSHRAFAQIVHQSCEGAVLGRTIDQNSIGAMFALKSVFGYQDTTTQVLEVRNASEQTTGEISAKYGALLEDNDGEILGAKELFDNSNHKQLALRNGNA